MVLGIAVAFLGFPQESESKSSLPQDRTEVFYATDRAYSPSKGYEGLRAFANDCRHSLLVGKASVSNSFLRLDDSKVAKAKVKVIHQGTINKGELLPGFCKELYSACKEKRLIIFVHGTNTRFEDAARSACKLSFCSGLPVLLFSWPSVGGLSNYQIDEANCEWSTFHFSRLLDYLEENCIIGEKGSSIVAHSLGNRVLIWARGEIGKFSSIKELLFVCPDIDGETFKHYVSGFSGSPALRYKLLFSRNDKALAFSQLLHGGYYRIGGGGRYIYW